MSDCSGYGIFASVNLCVNGPVGGGNRADLNIQLVNTVGFAFNPSPKNFLISNWDGSEVFIDLKAEGVLGGGLNSSNCDIRSASLRITPDSGGSDMGTIEIRYVLDNCSEASINLPQVYERCGGAGPHVISEKMVFTLEATGCPA